MSYQRCAGLLGGKAEVPCVLPVELWWNFGMKF